MFLHYFCTLQALEKLKSVPQLYEYVMERTKEHFPKQLTTKRRKETGMKQLEGKGAYFEASEFIK